ncbi:MAG: DUF433 domain-containing protein [Saprospirales bacterium]|nr:DUF433 domain-containing protein [Saprospirales bacterium]
MEYLIDRITLDEKTCNGKPTIRGKRITVQTILEFLAAGDSSEEILAQYPSLTMEDIKACLQFATELMKRTYVINAVAHTQISSSEGTPYVSSLL